MENIFHSISDFIESLLSNFRSYFHSVILKAVEIRSS